MAIKKLEKHEQFDLLEEVVEGFDKSISALNKLARQKELDGINIGRVDNWLAHLKEFRAVAVEEFDNESVPRERRTD